MTKSPTERCRWFALCTNAATTTRPHPILGRVPICARCDGLVRRLEGETKTPA